MIIRVNYNFYLSGHTRQGLKCRLCKLNVHIDCQERVGKCQTKSRLLRRQKSSSEIETRGGNPPEDEGTTTDFYFIFIIAIFYLSLH